MQPNTNHRQRWPMQCIIEGLTGSGFLGCWLVAYPDGEVERCERGGAGHPEPVGLVRLHGEYHRRALPVDGGGALIDPRRVRCGQRAVELASPVDQQRLQRSS